MAIDVSQFAQNTAAITNSQSNAANSFVNALLQREQQKEKEQQLLQEQLLKQQEARTKAEMEQASDPAYILSLVRQGVQPTQQQQAILDIESAKAQKAFFHPITGKFMQSGGFPEYNVAPQPQQAGATATQSQRNLDPAVAAEIAAEQNPARREQLVQQGNQSLLSGVTSPIARTPVGQRALFESQLDIAKEIELDRYRGQQDMVKSRPLAERAFKSLSDKVLDISETAERAIGQSNAFTTGAGSLLSIVPGTPSRNLKATLNTIQADAAFSELQQMRDNSPTGGALGAISEKELDLLRDAKVALDQSQTEEQFDANIKKYAEIRKRALNNVAEAFKQDYGEYPVGYQAQENKETPSIKDGAIATNPNTGERIIFRNGQWQPM